MSQKKSGNNFFLFSFLPAILYWYMEEHYPVKTALIAGIALSLIEIAAEKYFYGHIHKLSKINLVLVVVLGGLSLIGEDGIWFKLQPSFSLLAMALFMAFKLKKGQGFFQELMEDMRPDGPHPPPEILRSMEVNLTFFFFGYALLMAILAIWFSTSTWAFFKTAGFFIVFLVFIVIQTVVNRRLSKR